MRSATRAMRVAERRGRRRAGDADQRAFGEHQAAAAAPRVDAERAQQRELRAAPRDRQRLRREHQQRAGEQRDQRQHVEVDAIRARHAARSRATSLSGRTTDDARRQHPRDALAHGAGSAPGRKRRSMRVQRAERDRTRPARRRCPSTANALLPATAERDPRSRRRHVARARPAASSGSPTRATPSVARGAGLRNDCVRRAAGRARSAVRRQRRRDRGGAEQIDADHAQRVRRARRPRASTSTTGTRDARRRRRARASHRALRRSRARGPRTSRSASPDSARHARRELVDRRRD